MFITTTELKTVAYKYQIDEITENDDDIAAQAIAAAIEEAQGYMRANNKREYKDGRLLYDVDAIFSATGTNRHALLLEMTKSIALWYLVRLANVDMLYEQVKERYDRAITWFNKVNKGDVTLKLPLLNGGDTDGDGDVDGDDQAAQFSIRYGSRPKFNHDLNGF
jgi:phage gp36-like protein